MTSSEIFRLLNYFSSGLAFITLFFSVKSYKRLPNYLIPIFVLLLVNVVTETLAWLSVTCFKQLNPLIILKIFTSIEFALISIFYGMFYKQYFRSFVFFLIIPLFLILNIIEYKMMGPTSSDYLSVSIESTCFILYSLFFFYYVLKNLLFENLLMTSVFWINSGILFYFAGNFFLFLFRSTILITDPLVMRILWATIHTFFNLVYNLFLIIGFWKARVKSI